MRKLVALATLTALLATGMSAKPHVKPVVNINTASGVELAYLPGIGKTLADRMVEQRPFKTLDELLTIKGIGPKKFARIKRYIVLKGETTAKRKIK